jgi:hypothetical protein
VCNTQSTSGQVNRLCGGIFGATVDAAANAAFVCGNKNKVFKS